jgi:outer membrane lipoprotein carrier protein
VIERAAGTFAFARPGKFRWTYDKPHKQVLVGDGAKLWIHDPDLNQVTVKRMDRAISSDARGALAGKDDITALFTLRDGGAPTGSTGWRPRPRRRTPASSACAWASRARRSPRWSCRTAWAGARCCVQRPEGQCAVSPESFTFAPPKGADVIEDAPPKK